MLPDEDRETVDLIISSANRKVSSPVPAIRVRLVLTPAISSESLPAPRLMLVLLEMLPKINVSEPEPPVNVEAVTAPATLIKERLSEPPAIFEPETVDVKLKVSEPVPAITEERLKAPATRRESLPAPKLKRVDVIVPPSKLIVSLPAPADTVEPVNRPFTDLVIWLLPSPTLRLDF